MPIDSLIPNLLTLSSRTNPITTFDDLPTDSYFINKEGSLMLKIDGAEVVLMGEETDIISERYSKSFLPVYCTLVPACMGLWDKNIELCMSLEEFDVNILGNGENLITISPSEDKEPSCSVTFKTIVIGRWFVFGDGTVAVKISPQRCQLLFRADGSQIAGKEPMKILADYTVREVIGATKLVID